MNNGDEQEYTIDENGMVVFTKLFLQKRGFCCNNNCRNCPYTEKQEERSA